MERKRVCIGGYCHHASGDCEFYDSLLNQWTPIASMTICRKDAGAVAILGYGLLVMGGMDSASDPLQSVELYDPLTNKWTTMTWTLPEPIYNFGAHCLDGILYLIGGSNWDGPTTKCWSMNLAQCLASSELPIWSPISPLPVPVDLITSVAV